ncbi:MAG: non-canonical purine NTP pyrophosphatase, RdgB/HAM1 family [Chloroflexota bacterium]|nr:MAG: non-canonical purine NTP pyrophosphatase, RdgB/HAM1 family [Chloroflexota bacterium]
MKLLLATNNIGKQKEIRALLENLDITLLSPLEMGLNLKVVEDGETYQANATIKARAFAQASGIWVLADDSGLEVDALDGAPGLRSARYAPNPHPTDADRRKFLLHNLKLHKRPWQAQFRCVVALAHPSGEIHHAEGICPGEIIPKERGTQGFGYDPIFLIPQKKLTMAELSMPEKNQLSHRALAISAIRPLLIKKILATRQF